MGKRRHPRPLLCSLSGQRLGLEAWPPSWPQPVDGGTAGDTIRLFTRGAQSDPRPPSIWGPCGADLGLVSEGLFWAAVSLASGSSKVIPAERHKLCGGQLLHRASWAQGRATVRHPSLVCPPHPRPYGFLPSPSALRPGGQRPERIVAQKRRTGGTWKAAASFSQDWTPWTGLGWLHLRHRLYW